MIHNIIKNNKKFLDTVPEPSTKRSPGRPSSKFRESIEKRRRRSRGAVMCTRLGFLGRLILQPESHAQIGHIMMYGEEFENTTIRAGKRYIHIEI